MGQYYRIIAGETVYGYSDKGHTIGKLMEFSFFGFQGMNALCDLLFKNPMRVVFAGDYAREYHEIAWKKDTPLATLQENGVSAFSKYLVNHTKQIYVDLEKYKSNCSVGPWCIHPLPLLTAVGNRKGGGDYYGANMPDVGIWANDIISLENEVPESFVEKDYYFKE